MFLESRSLDDRGHIVKPICGIGTANLAKVSEKLEFEWYPSVSRGHPVQESCCLASVSYSIDRRWQEKQFCPRIMEITPIRQIAAAPIHAIAIGRFVAAF